LPWPKFQGLLLKGLSEFALLLLNPETLATFTLTNRYRLEEIAPAAPQDGD